MIWGEATIAGRRSRSSWRRSPPASATRAQGALGDGELFGQAHHRRDRRAAARAAGDRAGRKADLDLFRGDGADRMPKSLLVVGSGAIGIEFASFYRTMGAEVTVVEVLPQILPVEDEEIARTRRKRFEKQGIKILTGAKVDQAREGRQRVTATIEDARAASRRSRPTG